MERDSRQAIEIALRSPFVELSDDEYRWFVHLWGDTATADAQLTSAYGLFGNRSALELLRDGGGFRFLPFLSAWRRRRLMAQIREIHGMNRGGTYA